MTKIYSCEQHNNGRVFQCVVKEYDHTLCVLRAVIGDAGEVRDITYTQWSFKSNPFVFVREFMSVLQHYMTGAYTLSELNEPDLF